MFEPEQMSIEVGDSQKDYQIGNMLNAVDAVVKMYTVGRGVDEEYASKALRVYAEELFEGGE